MLINNPVITGSFTVNGVSVVGITGSSELSSSYLALSASYLITSASYAQSSASLSIRTGNLEATSSTLVSASSSFAAQSASLSSRVSIVEGQDATTGSNVFTGTQYISEASNAISFTSTASLYTDGGLRVSKDSFVSGTAYFNNITVYGTSSIEYITSSQVDIGANIITVNTDTPAVRFGGLSVFDSGSTQLTGSLFWDSEKNHWIYSNPSGSSYNSAMLMNGPRNTGSLGDEEGTTLNALMKGQGGDHITSSQIFDDGTTVRIPGNLQVTGSLSGSSAVFTSGLINGTTDAFFDINRSASGNASRVRFQTTGSDEFEIGLKGGVAGFHITKGDATELVTVLTSGNVGIGTTPNTTAGITELAIGSSNTNPLISGIRDGVSAFSLSSASGGTSLFERRNLELTIGTNNTTRLTIANTGAATFSSSVTATNGYFGPTSNQVRLTSQGTFQSTTLDAYIVNADGTGAYGSGDLLIQPRSYSGGGANNIVFGTSNNTNTVTERMRITSGGNVGIGTASPGNFKLYVNNGSSSNKAVKIDIGYGVGSADFGGLDISRSNTNTVGDGSSVIFSALRSDNAETEYGGYGSTIETNTAGSHAGRLQLMTSYNGVTRIPRMIVTGVGNVLIGKTTDDGQRLQVNGAVRTDNVGLIRASSFRGGLYTYDAVIGSGTDYGITIFAEGGTGNGNIYFCPGGSTTKAMTIASSGAVTILGSLSKGSGSFRIKHPLASKKNTHQLVHSFIEGPQADLLYSGAVTLVNGKAIINIDEAATMTEGTFEALCRNIRVFTSNETSWDNVRGKVEGNILTIECQNTESTDEISWLVIGERQDEHMMDTEWTDGNGKVIVEPLIPTESE